MDSNRNGAFCGRCGSLKRGGANGVCPKCALPKKAEEQKPLEQRIRDALSGNERTYNMLQYASGQTELKIGDFISRLPDFYKDAVAGFIKGKLVFQDGKELAEVAVHQHLLASDLDELRTNHHDFPRGLDAFIKKRKVGNYTYAESYYFRAPYNLLLSAGLEIIPGEYYIILNRAMYFRVDSVKRMLNSIKGKITAQSDFGKSEFEIEIGAGVRKPEVPENLKIKKPQNPLAGFILIPKDFGLE